MRKFKCLLVVSLIAMLGIGILAGCSIGGGFYLSPETQLLVTYCGNGGDIDSNVERYLYMQEDVRAIEPQVGTASPIKPVSRTGYRFVGWRVCKLNEDGKPLLRDDPISSADGGVWVTDNGEGDAIAEKDIPDFKNVVKKFYDYTDIEWVFDRDIIPKEGLALVAVWAEYNKFIIANNNNGEWENLDALTDDSFNLESPLYEQYADRLVDVTSDNGTQIFEAKVSAAFRAARPDKTALKFYHDKECQNEMKFPLIADKLITVVYYKEIDGAYNLVSNGSAFIAALNNNKNIYLLGDVGLGDFSANNAVYTGIIEGNGHTVIGNTKKISQTHCEGEDSSKNIYGGIFGDLDGATIKDVKFQVTINFEIAVDPDAADKAKGGEADRNCYIGVLARSMKNCTISNVSVEAKYVISRLKIRISVDNKSEFVYNEYNVTVYFNGLLPDGTDGNNAITDCTFSVANAGKEQAGSPDTQAPDQSDPSQTPSEPKDENDNNNEGGNENNQDDELEE